MAITPKPLFQVVPGNALAAELYRPASSARLEQIVFINRDASARTISIYHDIDGRVIDDAALILKDESVPAGGRYVFDEPILMDSNGSLGVKVEVADLINVVGYGWEDL